MGRLREGIHALEQFLPNQLPRHVQIDLLDHDQAPLLLRRPGEELVDFLEEEGKRGEEEEEETKN